VVSKVHAPDPYRPQARIAIDAAGNRLGYAMEINLWETLPGTGRPSSVTAPIDPATVDFDPLALLQ
jgi:hypothetical protein